VAVVAMLATILVGTVSALEASRPQPQGTLRDARKATGWVCEAGGYEAALVVSEVAWRCSCCAAPA